MLAKRAVALKPSPTLAIAAKAKELSAQGFNVISLSVGEPDWDTFDPVKSAGIHAIQAGQTRYAPANGLPQLRTAIAHQARQFYGVEYAPTQVTVSAGAKFIIFAALQMLCDPGDEVLVPAPYWVSYPTMVELAEAKPVIVPSDESTGFKPHGVDFERHVSARTKVLLLNSPNNPTGQVYTRQELDGIAKFLKRHPRVVLISDDIYNQLVFEDDTVAPHILHVAPELKDRVISVNGASKSLSMTGWRLGWALGPEPVIKAMSNYQSQSVSCAAPFTQLAGLAGIENCQTAIGDAVSLLRERRDLFIEALNDVPGIRAEPPRGAFYVWADVRALLGRVFRGQPLTGTAELAAALLDSQKVAVVPGAESGVEGFLRLSFAVSESELNEAVKRLRAFVAGLE